MRFACLVGVGLAAIPACTGSASQRAEPQLPPRPTATAIPVATTAPIAGPADLVEALIPPASTPVPVWYRADAVGRQWSEAVDGVLTFRGSPNRTFQGSGPVPANPRVHWTYPGSKMCSLSSDPDGEREWCGTGWTGQPAVWERNGELWVAFGAYDRAVHVLDAATGAPRFAPFVTGDLIKGTLTVDPDGHPLLYVGSRDNKLRVISWDRGELRELWALDATAVPAPTLWNDDWDGSPVVLDDYLLIGGENSNFHVIALNRGYDTDGLATVSPQLLHVVAGWDDELLRAVGENVSIESSVTVVDDIAYFTNSGGLVQGWDLSGVRAGESPTRVFRFWLGDDSDASVVVDDEGYLYAAAEYERATERSRQLGQIVKLDPRRPDDPLVWSVDARAGVDTGVWATPVVHRDLVVVPTADGRVLGLDRGSGAERWALRLPGPLWSSPVVVDDTLIQADCGGSVRAFDVSDTSAQPRERWRLAVGGCIESTPTVWSGGIWVGTRGGYMHLLAD